MSSGFSTRSDINQAARHKKTPRGLKFRIKGVEALYSIYVAKTKTLINCVVTSEYFPE